MIVALDVSFAKNIAVAWEIKGKINFGCVEFSKKELNKEDRDLYNMATKVFDFLQKKVKISNSNDVHLSIEGQFMGVNPASVIGLIELRSLVQGMIHITYPEINLYTVHPREWQSKVLNLGRARREEIKEKSIKMASKLTNSNPNEDEADAIHILTYTKNFLI